MKYSFYNDYSEGAHPKVLEALCVENDGQESGYGNDTVSSRSADLIRKEIDRPDAAVHFVSGGTQANIVCLASMLKPYESVIAADSGHVNVHEAGAIEAAGHRINAVKNAEGKVTSEVIRQVCDAHEDEHMVKPRAVFVSQATELGTVYTKRELEEISSICKERGLYLYLDGARLGCGLTAVNADMSLADIARLVDMFYIGGTKNGALFGEAIVLVNPELQPDFRWHLKQRGALLAKGRAIGSLFAALFQDGLYFDLARHANAMAEKLADGIRDMGYPFLTESTTNQIFPILPQPLIEKLKKEYGFYVWSKVDDEHSAIRLVTSWATPEAVVDGFLSDLKSA